MDNNNNKNVSSLIGISFIAIWGFILLFMMLSSINKFANQYNNTCNNSYSENC